MGGWHAGEHENGQFTSPVCHSVLGTWDTTC